jgi:hypothetical protein
MGCSSSALAAGGPDLRYWRYPNSRPASAIVEPRAHRTMLRVLSSIVVYFEMGLVVEGVDRAMAGKNDSLGVKTDCVGRRSERYFI